LPAADLRAAEEIIQVQKIDPRLVGRPRHHHRRTTASKTLAAPSRKLLLPVVDLVRMDPELARQLGDRPFLLDRRRRYVRPERRVVLLPCALNVLLALSTPSRGRAPP